MKVCTKCSVAKELNEFVKDKGRKDGRRAVCKLCWTSYMQDYYAKNSNQRVKKNERNSISRPSWKRHGLTESEYSKLLDKSDGVCYACKQDVATCIDHDKACCSGHYSCGKCVRGLLCHHCNSALGFIKDDPKRAYAIIEYLHSTVTQLVE